MVAVVAVVARQLQAGLAEATEEAELVMELVAAAEVHALRQLALLAMVVQARKAL
jgi:hypothetical protein